MKEIFRCNFKYSLLSNLERGFSVGLVMKNGYFKLNYMGRDV